MSETLEAPSNALVLIEALTPMQVFAPNAAEKLIAQIEAQVRATTIDISTPAGRKACASLAYKIARSKTALDKMGKDLNEERRAAINAVDAERRVIRDRLDRLADEVRRPLDEYEAVEAARVADHERRLAAIPEAPGYGLHESPDQIRARLDALRSPPPRDWQEFRVRAERAFADEIARMEGLLVLAEKREAEAAELARLKAEEEERRRVAAEEERRHREAELARKAAEAARIEAEQRAAEEARRREAAAERERQAAAERERREREQREEAERQRIAAEERAVRAERERAEAAAQAERDRLAAEERAAREREEAIAAERARIERQAAERAEQERKAAQAREANIAHKRKINREALQDLCGAADLTSEQAEAAVTAIARGQVRHISIAY